MTNSPLQPDPQNAAEACDERDLVISRVADGRAGDSEWAALRRLAEADGAVWADLAETRRQHGLLVEAIEPGLAAAQRHGLPELSLRGGAGWRERAGRVNWRSGLGWAAAAAVALAWWAGVNPRAGTSGPGVQGAAIMPVVNTNPDELFSRYVDAGRQQGRVVAELPERVVLETRPLGDGSGTEVLFLRQVLERATVSDEAMYRVGTNDAGQRVLVPVQRVRGTPGPAL